ncbi:MULTISPECIES: TetR/AcrR family transcriptional regulator [Pseudomonas]|uniref:TetR family transcriptional regulator n=1 Tax=Pseudomonas frederiksbergensis TaxID=104087 RepID=A0A0B1ZB58_9PSED|nr:MULTISPECIES: TetR/AcrR family transcriptional regulator [Pseudomonas]MBI6619104.1 TetR/AcrR family transcriptional regulator [Pseudomonas corrugata]KHK66456.1 TetR family transcriptional regulator [Pseudomonas frederiksbergensis]KJH86079.1 TetR family transcriptional regulator [Pseudomonas fluorescens]MBI6693176.1 TetR/AcrR family transcriptional regulator [Pseudomonas corrugata]WRV70941.1 TetR/AcrR family transcriptional regulator [Pseudomonas frederiksbergensis]
MIKKRLGREESQQITRDKLFDTATELMIKKGFHAASVNTISEEAGYSKGAFFSNFSSKSELLLQLTQRFKRVEIDRLGNTLAGGYSAEQLTQGLNAYIDTLKNNTNCAVLDAEMQLIALRDEEFAKHYYDLHEENSEALGKLITIIFNHAGKKPPLAYAALAKTFTALSEGLILQGHKDPATEIKLVLNSLIETAEPL